MKFEELKMLEKSSSGGGTEKSLSFPTLS